MSKSFYPRGYPRDSWRMDNVTPPSTWDREHWSFDESKRTKRARLSKPRTKIIDAATKFLEELVRLGKGVSK